MDPLTKQISIEGKHNKYQMKQAQREKVREIKKNTFNENLDLSHYNQVCSINKIFLDLDFNEKKTYVSEIRKKILSYKNQDLKKERYNENDFVVFDEIIEKLLISKLKCNYCTSDIFILTNKNRDGKQWTLERIDNNIGHVNSNVIISCLECNLKRRNSNMDNFKFTKKLKINKGF